MILNLITKHIKSLSLRAVAFQSQIRLIGAKYHCSVCNRRVKTFQPIPEFYSDNARKYGFPYGEQDVETCNYQHYSCPFCAASDRDRLCALYIQKYLASVKIDEVVNILDIAPSPPLSRLIRNIELSNRNISYRTADLFVEEGVDDKVDITDMNIYEDNQFNFFICSHVLEHVVADRKALLELYRILKPGGRGILMVPIVLGIKEIDEDPSVVDEADRWRRFGQFNHVRLYSKDGFIQRVKDAGFLLHQHGIEFFGEKTFIQTGITSQSVLYVVEKY